MKNEIINTIKKYNMLSGSESVIAAVSGGADSMCLLHFLYTMKDELKIKRLMAAHVNHNIRGAEAKRDEDFVRDYCAFINIPVFVLNADVPAASQKFGTGIEETARKIRYDYFKELSISHNALVATAHNSDDNAETVIYNLARGSGLKGAAGIPPKRDYIIRPLIETSREQIEKYCRENSLQYITDSTNLSDEYTRNKIRHNVLPVLKGINPSFERAISLSSQRLRSDDEFLLSLAKDKIKKAKIDGGYSVSVLKCLPEPLLSRAVISIIDECAHIKADSTATALVCRAIKQGGRVNISNNLFADARSGVFRIYGAQKKTEAKACRVQGFCKKNIAGREISFELISKEDYDVKLKFNNLLFKYAIDYDIIQADTVVRTRKSGDFFAPANRGFTKSLKKFLIDEKTLSEQRDRLLLIANDSNVLWLEGFGASRDAKVTSKTQKALIIRLSSDLEEALDE